MSAFNTVTGETACPNCGRIAEFEVQFKYGDTWQHSYRVGDRIKWGGNDVGVPNRKRVSVEGIGGPCLYCQMDALDFDIDIENDYLVRIGPVRDGRVHATPEGFVVVEP